MNLKLLTYVITVAEQKSFTKAAKLLYIAQPSLSMSIRTEEARLGVQLFDRSTSPLGLTPAGQEYVRRAKQILFMEEELQRRMYDFTDNQQAVLNIGILPECGALILPRALRAFTQGKPGRTVHIEELSSNDLEQAMDTMPIDFIVGLYHPNTLKYASEPIYDEHILLAIPEASDFPQPSGQEADLADYLDTPFVSLAKGQFLYRLTHDLCGKSGFVPKIAVECYNLQTAMYIAKAGVGVALIPDQMSPLVEGFHYYRLKGYDPQSQISIVYHRNRYLSKEARELIALIKEDVLQNTNPKL